jgi:hypothetical protein
MTNFWLLDKLHRDTAPVPFLNIIYREIDQAIYQICTVTAPARNKNCTRTAKSTPYLSCHRDSFLPKVPGPVAGWLRQVTQPPFIAGPLWFIYNPLKMNRILLLFTFIVLVICSCSQKSDYRFFKSEQAICDKFGFPMDSSSSYFPKKFFNDTMPAVYNGNSILRLYAGLSKSQIARNYNIDISALKDTFTLENNSFLLKYLSYSLFKMQEPILYDHYLKRDIIRLSVFRAFNPSLIVRFEKKGASILVSVKKLNKGIGYPFIIYSVPSNNELIYSPPEVASFDSTQNKTIIHDSINYNKLLTEQNKEQDSLARIYNVINYHLVKDTTFLVEPSTWNSLQLMIDSARFWSLKSDMALDYLQVDGSRWILEGQTKYKYHIKAIPSPNFESTPYANDFDKNNIYARMFRFIMESAHLEKERMY